MRERRVRPREPPAVMMGDMREEDRERSPLHELGERGGIGGLFDLSETREKFRPRGRRSGVNVGLTSSVRSPLVGLVYLSTDNDSVQLHQRSEPSL